MGTLQPGPSDETGEALRVIAGPNSGGAFSEPPQPGMSHTTAANSSDSPSSWRRHSRLLPGPPWSRTSGAPAGAAVGDAQPVDHDLAYLHLRHDGRKSYGPPDARRKGVRVSASDGVERLSPTESHYLAATVIARTHLSEGHWIAPKSAFHPFGERMRGAQLSSQPETPAGLLPPLADRLPVVRQLDGVILRCLSASHTCWGVAGSRSRAELTYPDGMAPISCMRARLSQ